MLEINKTYRTKIYNLPCINMSSTDNISTIVNRNFTSHHNQSDLVNTFFMTLSNNVSKRNINVFQSFSYISNIILIDSEKKENLEKLQNISNLKEGWNGNGAKAFNRTFIANVKDIILFLNHQPEIFPTACDSIQFEYDKLDGSYLEIEVKEFASTWEIFKIDASGKESISTISANINALNKEANQFYG